MKVMIDTNIILDYLLNRKPFADTADKIVKACQQGKIDGCIAAHTIPNIFYILRKAYSLEERRIILKDICRIFDIESIDRSIINTALENGQFRDFEECLQMECAREGKAAYIVTRNIKDFKYVILAARKQRLYGYGLCKKQGEKE